MKKFDEDFKKIFINSKESNMLYFKQKVTSEEKIARTLVAMANSDGGIVLIGLSDQKKIIGIDPEEENTGSSQPMKFFAFREYLY